MPLTIEWTIGSGLELIKEGSIRMFWIRRIVVYGYHHSALSNVFSWSVDVTHLLSDTHCGLNGSGEVATFQAVRKQMLQPMNLVERRKPLVPGGVVSSQ